MNRNEFDKEAVEAAQNTDPANDPATEPTLSADAEPDPETVSVAVPSLSQADHAAAVQERDQLRDTLARLQAEFANASRRQAKERAEIRDLVVGSTIEPLLPALDNFHLALQAQGTAEQFRTGVDLIARQLEDALKSMGVVPVETVGTQFDPHVHEALGSIETSDVPDHQVIEELRRGYKLKDKLLRPAQVRVASNTTTKEA